VAQFPFPNGAIDIDTEDDWKKFHHLTATRLN
jgi:hypothetical protein